MIALLFEVVLQHLLLGSEKVLDWQLVQLVFVPTIGSTSIIFDSDNRLYRLVVMHALIHTHVTIVIKIGYAFVKNIGCHWDVFVVEMKKLRNDFRMLHVNYTKTIACSIERCEETFHMGCMAEMKCIPLELLQGSGANLFICPRCEFRSTNNADVATWSDASPTTKLGRVGFDYRVDVNRVSDRTKKRKLENIAANYRLCGNNDGLLDLDPNAYPTYVLMDREMKKKNMSRSVDVSKC